MGRQPDASSADRRWLQRGVHLPYQDLGTGFARDYAELSCIGNPGRIAGEQDLPTFQLNLPTRNKDVQEPCVRQLTAPPRRESAGQ